MKLSEEVKVRLVRVIAEGGMGTVHEGLLLGPEGFEKRVCVKMIKEEFAKEPNFMERFVMEAKLVADLVHQNIVQIYKLGRDDGSTFIIMEYVHGVTLQQFMRTHVEMRLWIPTEIAALIGARICRALEYAHAHRGRDGRPMEVVHRDVSPKNVMLSSEGEVKITDFGVAKAAMRPEKEGEIVLGKLSYMSPEQALGMTTDLRTDIYSVGVLLYEMLTLKKLFSAEAGTDVVLEQKQTQEVPSLSELNPQVTEELETIVRTALERDPVKRFPDAGAMGYDLEYFLARSGPGPTNLSLVTYLRQLFPDLYSKQGDSK